MLIPYNKVCTILAQHGIQVRGILHVGAHECEELRDYVAAGVTANNIVWVEGNQDKVALMKARGVPNVYYGLVSDNEEDVVFNITNNGQSSSILALETHKVEHPQVYVSEVRNQRTTTLKKLVEENGIDARRLNFWNFDIQGAELMALRGAGDLLESADALYLEVNEKELYKGCALLGEMDAFLAERGFRRVDMVMLNHGWGDAVYVRVKV